MYICNVFDDWKKKVNKLNGLSCSSIFFLTSTGMLEGEVIADNFFGKMLICFTAKCLIWLT